MSSITRTPTAPSTYNSLIELPLLLSSIVHHVVQGVRPTPVPTPLTLDDPEDLVRHSRRHSRCTSAEMRLSADCDNCGELVHVSVPAWMLSRLEEAGRGRAGAQAQASQTQRQSKQVEWRDGVVGGAVQVAAFIKASPVSTCFAETFVFPGARMLTSSEQIPGILYSIMTSIFGCMVYLNARFNLLQRAFAVLTIVLEGLLEVEKEVGIFRSAGEGLSILWYGSQDSRRLLPLIAL